ncbi:MAG: gluconolaconase [Acidobacteriota bacterium]|nr:gluconolaconase [Acidobacteriota bacterium]
MLEKTACPFLVALALSSALPAPAETLLVANKSDHTVDLIDLESGRSRATLPTGRAPHEVATSTDGRTAVIANYGDRSMPGSSLTVVDVATAKVLRTVTLDPHTRPHGVVFLTPDRVAVTTEGSAHLVIVDTTDGTIVNAIRTDQAVSHMVTVAAGRAFVANIGSGTVTVLDLETGEKLGDVVTGDGAEGIAVTPDGKEIWVGNRAADTVTIIDPSSLEVRASLPCPGFPIRVAITPDGRHALVSAARSGEVVLFDIAERREIRRAKLDLSTAPDAAQRLFGERFGDSPVPVGLVIAPRGDRAWVAATQADAVVMIEPTTLAVIGALKAGKEPDGMAYSALGATAE